MKNTPKYLMRFFTFLLLAFLIINCKKSTVEPPIPPVVRPVVSPIKEATDVNKFIFNGLRDYYLWVDQVPNLIATKYEKKDTLNNFLNKYTDPNKLFTDLLYQYKTVDKWSFIVDDSKIIENWIQGISETMGFDFMLGRFSNSDYLFGFVRYVFKGSPAEKAGMKRGDLFMKVDGEQLTLTNYQTLLFTKITYTLHFASVTSDNKISLNNKTATMTAIQMQENPIQLDTVLNVGTTKVGYLVYNGFTADFDIPLNNVFKKFKDAGITKLVLDLRYNGGGSVQTARYLASMIYSTATTKVFLKSVYNAGLQAYIISENGEASLIQNFTDKIAKTATTPETPINTLNLSSLYVITSDNSASASELLINGLKPYIQVFNIGTNSAGKYVGSWTIKDWIDDKGTINPSHKWAMQPIVVKIANANGLSDYINGLTPDFEAKEDVVRLLPFGDQNETLLRVALTNLKGLPLSKISLKSDQLGLKKVFDSQDIRPFPKQMYINKPIKN